MHPQTISHYRLIRQIGSGGMGVVYRAEDTKLGRGVALKFLPPELFTNREAVERFQREARAASALNHPNIRTIYEIDEQAGQPFLVMELLEGHTLKHMMRGQPLPLNQVLDLGLQIAHGLDAAHSSGIVHRDIKPENIFVTPRGQVKILDFGLANLARRKSVFDDEPTASTGASEGEHPTNAGNIVGTLAYMAPELALPLGDVADDRSDIYSFGALLYEMATGRYPFAEEVRAGKVLFAILHIMPPRPRLLNPDVPPTLEAIILKCLEKRPYKRFQSMKEIADALSVLERAELRHWAYVPSEVVIVNRVVITPFSSLFLRISAMESGQRFAWLMLAVMSAMFLVGLIPLRGTVLGFGLTFGAALLAYESYLLLRTYK